MAKAADDLEAVRVVVDALQGFKEEDQLRIFRWAAEKLGIKAGLFTQPAPFQPFPQQTSPANPPGTPPALGTAKDIKSFVDEKRPRSDVQFAAAVAYYYEFMAPQAERRTAISPDDLQNAARLAGRERFPVPGQTLRNAHKLGLLDKGEEAGSFSINTVGENLVAMGLPGDQGSPVKAKKKSGRGRVAEKQTRKNKA